MSSINYSEKIPNNVNLSEDRTLQRALESWQPDFINWWDDMGPEGTTDANVYLRTAVSVDPQGWAQFGHVKMRDYRWGIFLNPGEADRKIHFGDHLGEKAWSDVPGEYRANLRRIIVTQGDTEPASVEQQRHLGLTAPSMYDLRNLFQINVEEGRHLWAMVYLLHKYFGKDGREEADALLQRNSGNEDNPRILQAFNEKTPDWLSFFMFTYFTDRDGKFQLCALAESAFDPLARTTKFMLTEEAHHMFVGESGVSRTIQRTVDVMNQLKTDDVAKLRAAGVEARIILFARPDREGLAQSTAAERATIAELWLTRDWTLYQRWTATPVRNWTAAGIPAADGNLARGAVVEAGRAFVARLSADLQEAGLSTRYPLIIWRDPEGFMKACACSDRRSWVFIRDDLDAPDRLDPPVIAPGDPAGPQAFPGDGTPESLPYPNLPPLAPADGLAPDETSAPAPVSPPVPRKAPEAKQAEDATFF